jgi:hypothetical protein
MENEIMNYEEEVMENEVDVFEAEHEESGIGTGLAILIGAGITAAGVAVVGLGKKLWAKHKAKKELRLVDEDDFVEVTDERVEEVTK